MTEAELIEAIREGMAHTDADGLSSEEIGQKMGVSRKRALEALKPLQRSGKLLVGFRRDYRTDGVPCKIPVYRVAA